MRNDRTFLGTRAPGGRSALPRNASIALAVAAAVGTWQAPSLYSWAYIFAGDRNGVDVVAYPPGYSGDGGTVRVTVGIDPTSPHAQEMVPSVRNIVATFNGLRPTTGNLVRGAGNNVPANYIDFESVALHEVGHALGLAHPNAATESELPHEEQDYTRATKGSNGRFDLDPGSDAVIGSSDDVRGDDVNLHWFRRSNNNPFTIAGTVDSTSYARDTADLPAGHRFAANADQTVGSRLGVANTEAVMQQGTAPDEAQRTLGHDDVAGLRYAMAGVDAQSGTADDYALVLEYAGLDASADIVIEFDDSETVFAVAKTRARVGGDRAFIVDSRVYFNDSFNWFFNRGGGTGGGPDLVVESATISDRTLMPGQSFSFSATVRNIGDARSPATTLNYHRRPSGGSFSVVGTDSIGGLSPSGTSEESVRLTAPAAVGTYEYEACAAAVGGESDTRNNCSTIVSVTVSPDGGGSCTNDLGLVTARLTRSGAWDGSCESVHYPFGEYARYYTFRLGRAASVTIDLTSPSVDTWLALRNGPGTGTGLIEQDNDDGAGTNARITRNLTPGMYTIEATTLLGGVTGPFTLTLDVGGSGGVGCTNDLGPVSGTVTRAGSWDGSCDSAHYTSGRYARYYAFRLSQSASVTIDLTSSVDTFLALRNGPGTGTGLIEEDDDGGSGLNSRITRMLAAGTYTIEATTLAPRRTGSFTLMLAVGAAGAGPDLVVESPGVSDAAPAAGESFTFSATVRNRGDRASASTSLTYRRRRPGGSWTVVGTDAVSGLSPSGSSVESIVLSAPAQGGTYEYGACVTPVTGESDTGNNCSGTVQVVVQAPPDLVVETPTVSDGSLMPGESFTLSASVRNQGGSASAATTLTFRRRRAGGAWTSVGTASVRALSPSAVSSESIGLTAPRDAGTYEYGACVSTVPGESDTGNNCSGTVQVVVQAPPDLVVETPTVSDGSLMPGESFTLSASVRNQGGSASAATTLTFRRRRAGGAWTSVGTASVRALSPSAVSSESIGLTAPRDAGTYEYGACVSTVPGESDTGNNCSGTVQVVVQAPPDLVVETPTVSDGSLMPGESFTLSASVRNQGGSASAATTLTFRRRRAGGAWTSVGTASVRALSPSAVSSESIGLTAPRDAGTYEYGACVSTVPGESDTGNNCSGTVQVVVQAPPDLVVETPTVDDGSLTSGQSFTLSARVLNQGGSESEAATLTYRRRRPGGAWVTEGTDSVGRLPASGTSDESIRLTAPAQAGAHEYGACVSTVQWESETANNCSEPVQVKVCTVERLGSVTVGRRTAGSWDSGCESANRPGRYARYYSFVLTRAVEVGISLASSSDSYLYLLAGSGTDGRVVASNDDIGGDEVNSRIVSTLSAGTYTVEATTFADAVTGSFTLRVRELRPFTDDPVVAGQPIEAEHITELRGRIDELRVSAGLGRYSWVDRTIRPGVTPVRAMHWRQLRTALDDVYDADGRRRPRYTGTIAVGVPIEAEHVNELRRAVEGL